MAPVIQAALKQIKKKETINNISLRMKKTICLFFFLLPFLNGRAQNVTDTNKLVFNSKLRMLEFLSGYEDEDYFKAYLSFKPEVTFLRSTGFGDRYIFYKVRVKDTAILKKPVNDTVISLRSFFLLMDGEVIFGFDRIRERIYPLIGFKHNDFLDFYNDVAVMFNLSQVKVTKKNFSKLFSIEGVDLACLCSELKKYTPPKCYKIVEPFQISPRWKQ